MLAAIRSMGFPTLICVIICVCQASQAEDVLAPPHASDLNRWHGVQFLKAANGRIGSPG